MPRVPSPALPKPGVVVCKSSTLEVRAGRSEVQAHPWLCSSFSQGYVRPCPQKQNKNTFSAILFFKPACPTGPRLQRHHGHLFSSPRPLRAHLLAAIMCVFPDSPACPDPQGLLTKSLSLTPACMALPIVISTALSHFQSLGHGALHPRLVHASSHLCFRYPKSLFLSCVSGHLCRLLRSQPYLPTNACSSPVHPRHHRSPVSA